MKYVALFTGAGDGCDYTIGCNMNFAVIEADDHKAAVRYCRMVWRSAGGEGGKPRVEGIELFVVSESVPVPVRKWNGLPKKVRVAKPDMLPVASGGQPSKELLAWLKRGDERAAIAAAGLSLQGWAIQTVKKAANGRDFISRDKVLKALRSTTGYCFPEDVTVEGVMDMLVKQMFLKPCSKGFEICL